MRIFVAGWFFPPETSSEGIVTYKLLRNSQNHYDVCSARNALWGYKQSLPLDANNITSYPIDTDDFEVWIEKTVELFERLHAQQPYDAFMTRSMPPESINVARQIVAKYPELPWIASLADPLAKAPNQIKVWVLESEELSEVQKADFLVALKAGTDAWKGKINPDITTMCELKDIEDYAINHAKALIFPDEALRDYVLDTRQRKNALIVPHAFDTTLYPDPSSPELAAAAAANPSKTLTFLGHSDQIRSLEPIVRAVNHLRTQDQKALDNLHIRFIGNVPEHVRTLVFNYYLHNYISIEPSVDYLTSLEIMQQTDWLVHVDAKFDFLPETGGSIYFAGKLADYMGTDTPILALTGHHSPADKIVRKAGGICLDPENTAGIAEALARISSDQLQVHINRDYRDKYNAIIVAQQYDKDLAKVLNPNPLAFTRDFWPEVPNAGNCTQKFLSICVPAYNVECYLDRCLFSLVSSEVANKLEIIVVNDGSPDSSRQIALAYQDHYPGIVKLIDKQNGGHGSTINTAIPIATGKYFRVIDGDDWVDSKNLSKLVRLIEEQDLYADLVSSNYYQVYAEDGHLVPWSKVSSIPEDIVHEFASSNLTMDYFTMASTMIKTSILQAANFQLQEHTFYVDVEYILFPIPYIQTFMFTLDFVYRYAVGNAEQSINPSNFVNRYDHHDRVIRRMLKYFAEKRAAMNKSQIDYVDTLFEWHFLKSHYMLSLLWDTDKTRGCERAQSFDEFLSQTNPALYKAVGKRYRAVRQARNSSFSPELAKKFVSMEDGTNGFSFKKALQSLSQSRLGRALAKNELARKLAHKILH